MMGPWFGRMQDPNYKSKRQAKKNKITRVMLYENANYYVIYKVHLPNFYNKGL